MLKNAHLFRHVQLSATMQVKATQPMINFMRKSNVHDAMTSCLIVKMPCWAFCFIFPTRLEKKIGDRSETVFWISSPPIGQLAGFTWRHWNQRQILYRISHSEPIGLTPLISDVCRNMLEETSTFHNIECWMCIQNESISKHEYGT